VEQATCVEEAEAVEVAVAAVVVVDHMAAVVVDIAEDETSPTHLAISNATSAASPVTLNAIVRKVVTVATSATKLDILRATARSRMTRTATIVINQDTFQGTVPKAGPMVVVAAVAVVVAVEAASTAVKVATSPASVRRPVAVVVVVVVQMDRRLREMRTRPRLPT